MATTKSFLERFNVIIGVMVLLVTIIGVWYQTKEESPELTIEVVNNDELTELSSTPNLTAKFKFNGDDVNHLWKLVFRIKNTGDLTLIGRGERSNLLENYIPIGFGSDSIIIDFEINYNDLNLSVIKKDNSSIQIKFDQWLSSESALITMYIESINGAEEKPFPLSLTRSLINGEIITHDLTSIKNKESSPPAVSYPKTILSFAKTISAIFLAISIFVVLLLAFWAPFDFYKFRLWKRKNYNLYSKHVEGFIDSEDKEKIIKHAIVRYKKHPEHLPEFMWGDFEGERYEGSNPINETIKGTIAISLISLAILASIFIVITGT